MLSAPDDSLIASDPALPGLRVLLDPDRLTELIDRSELGPAGGSVAAHYVRYKPGTRCVAACRVVRNGQSVALHAVAHGRDAAAKLAKRRVQRGVESLLGAGSALFPELGVSLNVFPNDGRLPSLARIGAAASRRALLERIFPRRPEFWSGELVPLAYKPERRFVAALEVGCERRAVLKFVTPSDFWTARRGPDEFGSDATIARRIGQSRKHGVLALEWLEGGLLRDVILGDDDLEAVDLAGAALAALHCGAPPDFEFEQKAELQRLGEVARILGRLLPAQATRAERLARVIATAIDERPARRKPIHGDFYSKQVVIDGGSVGLLDFDRAGAGDPAIDLGLFRAHAERDVIRGDFSRERAARAVQRLQDGYSRTTRLPDEGLTTLWTAAGLLAISIHHFRNREPDWHLRTLTTLARIEELLGGSDEGRATRGKASRSGSIMARRPQLDPEIPCLAEALDPRAVNRELRSTAEASDVRITRACLLRHKPGRRAVLRYDVEVAGRETVWLGKLRARGVDRDAFETSRALQRCGFGSDSLDGFSTPDPILMLPRLHMSLYRFVEATPSTSLWLGESGVSLARSVAELAHKLHRVKFPLTRSHDISAELAILRERLAQLAVARTSLQPRLATLMSACESLATLIPRGSTCGIHRDFHLDQVLVQEERVLERSDPARVRGSRLFLVDLDLCCEGDPALDIGNFLAHLTEFALREGGDANSLRICEDALERRYLELAREVPRASIRAHRLLSLARHVSISDQFPDRRHLTERLLALCEYEFRRGALR